MTVEEKKVEEQVEKVEADGIVNKELNAALQKGTIVLAPAKGEKE